MGPKGDEVNVSFRRILVATTLMAYYRYCLSQDIF